MITQLEKFSPLNSFNFELIKRFGCLVNIKVERKTSPKFRFEGRRVILVGYKPKDNQFLKPVEGKYESRCKI